MLYKIVTRAQVWFDEDWEDAMVFLMFKEESNTSSIGYQFCPPFKW